MRIEGRSTEQICAALEVERRTVYLWFSDPLVKAELAGQVDHVNELFAERLAGAGLKALEALCEMASQPAHGDLTPETKLRALREVLDRALAARQSPQATERPFAQLSDQELVDLARSLAARAGNGNPPIPPNAREPRVM